MSELLSELRGGEPLKRNIRGFSFLLGVGDGGHSRSSRIR